MAISRIFKKIGMFLFVLSLVLNVSTITAEGTNSNSADRRILVPVGMTAGIKLFSDGVLVVGMSEVETESGNISPATEAGVKPGDIIVEVNGKKIVSTENLRDSMNNSNKVKMTIIRDSKKIEVTIKPAVSVKDGSKKLGAWVRDSMAGIGTLTYYDPQTGMFGALGHGINDVDTQSLMPLSSGSLVRSEVTSVRAGEPGNPGELKGQFDASVEYGNLMANTEQGVYGRLIGEVTIPSISEPIPIAFADEITTGNATILANVEGDKIVQYDILIKKVYAPSGNSPRDMTIEITDPRLLEITGGIVQGMSGSPIIQNGKLIGAVTHVLINEPVKGYGIFIGRMLEISDSLNG